MQSADITVIPTGGSTPVDLADLAAAVQALQASVHAAAIKIWASPYYYAPGDSLSMNVAKQTGVIENLDITIDGNPATTNTAVTDMPDGLYSYTFSSVPSTPGTHTVQIQGATSGATVSATYSV